MSNATRTPQQAMKDAIKSGAVQAWLDGKPIQLAAIEHTNKWNNLTHNDPYFNGPTLFWRPAPTPRLRPWKPEEVPIGAQYHDHGWISGVRATIVSAGVSAFSYIIDDAICSTTYQAALKHGEHSLDGGKTWAPCGVMEGGE